MDLIKQKIMEKLMSKYYLIFNILLLSHANLIAQDTTNLVEGNLLESKESLIKIENQKNIYPGKPLIMSLILPGSGQLYNQSPVWKTALFFGTELTSLLAWRNFKNKAEDYRKEYQSFADSYWTLEDWVLNRWESNDPEWASIPALGSLTGTHDLRLVISENLANELNIFGNISSDSLENSEWINWVINGDVEVVRDRHFYENIGKYDQFVGGWQDAKEEWYKEEKNVGDSTEIIIKTPLKQSYIDDRYVANQMLNYAKYSITVLMFNHVISGIESVWYSQKKASEKLKEASNFPTNINLVFNPQNPLGIGGVRMAWSF